MTPGLAASIIGGGAQQDVQSQQVPNTSSMMLIGSQMDLVSALRGLMDNEDAMVQELKSVTKELRVLNQRTGMMGQIRNAIVGKEVWETGHHTAETMGTGTTTIPGSFTAVGQAASKNLSEQFESALREAVISILEDIKEMPRRRTPGQPTEPAKGRQKPSEPSPGDGGREPPGKPRPAPGGAPEPSRPEPHHKPGEHARTLDEMRSRAGLQHNLLGRIASSKKIQGWEPKGDIGQAIKGGLEYAGGEGGSALGGAAEALGELGLSGPLAVVTGGLTAAGLVVNQMESQRAANAKWQSIMGGSNLAGLGQRAQSRMFQFSQMGVMGGREAQQLFYGVSEVGLRGGTRQSALDFATQGYKNLGMSISDSLELINTAAQHGQEGLAGVATALTNVTNAAKVAGVNAEQARQLFSATVATTSNVVGGAGAVGISQALTTSLTSSGLQRIFGTTGLSGLVTQNNIAMGAAQGGMTYTGALSMLNDPNVPDQKKLQLITGPAFNLVSNVLPPSVQQYLKANVKKGMASSELIAVGLEAMKRANIDARVGERWAATFGTPTGTPDQMAAFIAGVGGGLVDPERDAAALEDKGKPFQPVAGQKVAREVQALKGTVSASSDVTPQQAYLQSVGRTGFESPIVQGLLTNKMTGRMFKVHSAEGDKIVDFKTAMSTYYDQMASGAAIDMTTGQAVSATVGMSTVAAANMPSALGDSASQKNVGQGETLAHYTARTQTAAAKAANQSNVTVTLDATDWLKQRFRFLDTATGTTDPNAALVPPPTQVTSSALPTGNP